MTGPELLVIGCLLVGCAVAWRALGRRAARTEALATARGELADELIQSAELERRRLAGAIHDGPVQQLMLARASLSDTSGAGVTAQRVAVANEAIGEAIDQLRGNMQDLHSHVLEFAGLEAALQSEGARAAPEGMRCEIRVDPRAVGFLDELVFALARELLLNATRHAHGTRVTVHVARQGGALELRVRDDGSGFDDARRLASLRAGHAGLASCAHRAEAAGGRFDVRSSDAGTEVVVTLPIGRTGRPTTRRRPIDVLPKSAR